MKEKRAKYLIAGLIILGALPPDESDALARALEARVAVTPELKLMAPVELGWRRTWRLEALLSAASRLNATPWSTGTFWSNGSVFASPSASLNRPTSRSMNCGVATADTGLYRTTSSSFSVMSSSSGPVTTTFFCRSTMGARMAIPFAPFWMCRPILCQA